MTLTGHGRPGALSSLRTGIAAMKIPIGGEMTSQAIARVTPPNEGALSAGGGHRARLLNAAATR